MITPPPPGRKWLDKWLCLDTKHHPKLLELEREVWNFCYGITKTPFEGRLLVLCGENGSGKTHCAKSIKNWFNTAMRGEMHVSTINVVRPAYLQFRMWPRLLDLMKSGEWELVKECCETDVLILDELGGGHDPSSVGTDKLCSILSARERKWTLITTNILPEFWEQTFDRRVASRFLRYSTIVDLGEVPDYSLSKMA